MRTQIWVYIVVALLSVGAGVAIAGVPDTSPREPTIQPPTTVETTVPVVEESTTTAPASEAEDSTDEAADAAETVPASTDEASDADGQTTTTTDAAPSTTLPLPERSVFAVAVVNGTEQTGVASGVAVLLEGDGYTDVNALNGDELVDETVLYAGVGLDLVAERLAGDLEIGVERIRPLDEAPEISELGDEQLVVYLGADVLDDQ